MAAFLESHLSLALALIVALGALSQWVAWRIGVPAILPLLTLGFLVGPVLGWVQPTEFIPPTLLYPAVSLAVGLILFEGGLTLRIPEVKETRGVVVRLVTLGALVTFLGGALAVHTLTGLPLPMSFLFGALIIVTGPTVIGPLLRIVRPEARVANILKWEGILIDAIGALVAVLVYELLVIDNREEALGQTVMLFLRFILVGTAAGVVGGAALAWVLRRRVVPDFLVNVVALGFVFAVFALANVFAHEAGLLATVLMGAIVANLGVPNIHGLLSFKEDLTILFINVLFIVLAANVSLDAFLAVLGVPTFALLAVVMLVLRPLAIFVSTHGSPLRMNEKLYLSWIAPRGIVAASVSALFAARLLEVGYPGADVLVPLVFLVIVGTVLLNSLTARPIGRLLGLAAPDPQGLLILGAHPFARRIAAILAEHDVPVLLADTNWSNVASARVEGLPAYYGSLLADKSDDELRLAGIGRLLALTSNDEANALASLKYAREFGSDNVYQLEPGARASDRDGLSEEQRGRVVFRRGVTYRELERLFQQGGQLKATEITERFNLADLEKRHQDGQLLPMFVINGHKVRVMTSSSPLPEPGSKLVSLVLEASPKEARAKV